MTYAILRAYGATSLAWLMVSVAAVNAQEAFQISCLPEQAVPTAGQTVRLDVWVTTGDRAVTQDVSVRWDVSSGRVTEQAPSTRWLLEGAPVDSQQSATVHVSVKGLATGSCSLRLWISDQPRLGRLRGEYITGRTLLKPNQAAAAGYGLYSYFLMRKPSSAADAARAESFVGAFLDAVPAIADQEFYLQRRQLNAALMPVNVPPSDGLSAPARKAWVLEHYDYEHANRLLSLYPSLSGRGPFIVAVPKPLGSQVMPMMKWDFSGFDSEATAQSVNRFVNQVAQLYDWQHPEALPTLRNRLVTIVASMFLGRAAAERWLQIIP